MTLPKTLNNIRRIQAPSAGRFHVRYVLKRKPAVLKGLFRNDPISQFKNLSAIRNKFFETEILLTPHYSYSFPGQKIKKLKKIKKGKTLLGKYLDLIAGRGLFDAICSEYPLPREIASLFGTPDYYRIPFDELSALARLFVGYQGSVASLHFDGDLRNVLLHQVFGRRRIVLIPIRESKKLFPITNLSALYLDTFTNGDLIDFVKYVNGYDFIVSPGETVYIPPLMWHYVEYVEPAMAVSFRFGRNEYARRLAGFETEKDLHFQSVAAKFLDAGPNDPFYKKIFRKIARTHAKKYGDRFEKYAALSRLYRDLYVSLCHDSIQGRDDFFTRITVEQILSRYFKFDESQERAFKLSFESRFFDF